MTKNFYVDDNINKYFFDEINHISAYWLGMIFSDGCIHGREKEKKAISLSSSDKEIVEKFIKCTGYKNKIAQTLIKENNTLHYGVNFVNSYMYDKLIELGCEERKTHVLKPPNIKNEFLFSFLCGYFDGDGSISLNTNVNSWKASIGFGSYLFYKWFNTILNNRNIIHSIDEKALPAGKRFYVITMNGLSAKYFLSLCYKNIPEGLMLQRKYEKYKTLCSEKLVNPKIQFWEIELVEKHGIIEGTKMINSDSRNYGWIRNNRSLERFK